MGYFCKILDDDPKKWYSEQPGESEGVYLEKLEAIEQDVEDRLADDREREPEGVEGGDEMRSPSDTPTNTKDRTVRKQIIK